LKAFTIFLVAPLAALSACILVPAPNLVLLPLTIAAPELSPCLLVFNLLAVAAAIRFYRPAIPFVIASLALSSWPLVQLQNIHILASNPAATQVYGTGNVTSLLLDCFRGGGADSIQPQRLPLHILYYPPKGGGATPAALIDIYGGAWQKGSPADMHRFDSHMALRGVAVFAIDYRHAPAFHFPAQLADVNAALWFIYSNAARYKVDPNRLVLCGRSSGAQLALLAAYEAGPVPVRAVISFYGPTNLTEGYSDLPSPDPIHVRSVLEAYLGGSPAQFPAVYRAASPVAYVNHALPPTLLIQGERDHIVKAVFARELYQGLQESGNRAFLLEIPWAEHGFDFVPFGLGNQLSLRYVEKFLDDTVGS